MLIVNADDLGRDKSATDAALACHAMGRITSTSAMVYMTDYERAAEMAHSSGISIGLHINLSESFSASKVPAHVRSGHEQIRRFLTGSKYALILYHPLLVQAFRDVVQAQYDEFARLYGGAPSHIDGHHHMHLATNVLVQRLLPQGSKVRRSFSFGADQKSMLNRWYRSRVDTLLAKRHRLSDHFFSLSHNLSSEGMESLVALAEDAEVEVMTHPARRREHEFLMSDAYAELMARSRRPATDVTEAA